MNSDRNEFPAIPLDREAWAQGPVAVLLSGGIDSAILLHQALSSSPQVIPVFVRFGLIWEEAELHFIRLLLKNLDAPNLQPLLILKSPLSSIYGKHWSTGASPVPDAKSPDEEVYLPGRNLFLLMPTAVWAQLNQVPTIALGILGGNPFPDSSPEFLTQLEYLLNTAAAASGGRKPPDSSATPISPTTTRSVPGKIRIIAPFRNQSKASLMAENPRVPFELTFSCLNPIGVSHCGECNKCEERKTSFLRAGINDPTNYSNDDRRNGLTWPQK